MVAEVLNGTSQPIAKRSAREIGAQRQPPAYGGRSDAPSSDIAVDRYKIGPPEVAIRSSRQLMAAWALMFASGDIAADRYKIGSRQSRLSGSCRHKAVCSTNHLNCDTWGQPDAASLVIWETSRQQPVATRPE